ncbi:uncharacterized protein C8Q71DRAFT_720031 [Rhodofomes roseus]|uniref:MTHFR SAM-binding regulatory domain-containing protein n=1 Tax=Rhodofomes roseus TaxID=34475 RepID=A0ABQ8KUJ1_9APHY|nr:uncharacterized protein C8Q71DRAFT_720031 [Rhodofomes roseus]KAH9842491.1 hypothetical protein C8Q71DRAFT_720031 [Rhodofomes roseus]
MTAPLVTVETLTEHIAHAKKKWVEAVRAGGITVPIVPGIAPIQTWNGFIKSTSLSQLLPAVEKFLTSDRRNETIRPIFWANRTKSYLSRTENWDEYPNGRFGDSRSPAYGGLDRYSIWIKQSKEDAIKLCDHPTPVWATSSASSVWASGQTRCRRPRQAWSGPSNGYMYQKMCTHLRLLTRIVTGVTGVLRVAGAAGRAPATHRVRVNITYYVINKRGDLRTNTHSEIGGFGASEDQGEVSKVWDKYYEALHV